MMDENKATLGVYGIQDRYLNEYPGYVHDHCIALMNEGAVRKYLQLERVTRQKRDNKLHHHISELMRQANLVDADFDAIFVDNLVGRAFISTDGQVRFEAPLSSRLSKEAEKAKLWWFNREASAYVLSHELAHVFSCLPFYGDFNDNSLLVHFDGGASLSNFSAWIYRQGKIVPVEHHWELKHLTKLYNANALTFGIIGSTIHDPNSVPGKLMGYAALGNYNEDIEFWLRQNKWFGDIWGKHSVFFEKAKADFGVDLTSFDQKNSLLQDVAATIQEIFMRETLLKLDDLNSLSNCKSLYYSGGCALNIHTNSAIVESGLFSNVYIPPCADDSGLALGAAAYGEWKKGHRIQVHHAYLNGWEVSPDVAYTSETVAKIAKLLVQRKVVGVCNGFGEAGPRALGNRSLLALPDKDLAHKVSVVQKKREWYRPVAPVMLAKNIPYFTGQSAINHLAKFMLLDFSILPNKQNEIAGVVHANGTARIQALFDRDQNPLIWDLLSVLESQHGIKALINTSFNVQGEPMVHTPNDARLAARSMKIDALLVDGVIETITL